MIRNEYIRFIKTFELFDVPNDVRKLANVVLNHFDEITPLGTAHGKRIQKIVELANNEFSTINIDCPIEIEDANPDIKKINRLISLSVGPFSGFAKSEDFDLDSQIVLIYGPNGSGKSSFCEALEYSLLGSVEEADSKRFAETCDYLKNAYVDQFSPPRVIANFVDADSDIVTANEVQFRFFFVEKNRIDSFSRIAAHLPSRQIELISTLFGVDSFNDFVRGFSSEIDDKYIDTIGEKARELSSRQLSLEGDKQTIVSNTPLLTELETEGKMLAENYKQDMSFSDLLLELGTEDQPGIIQKIDSELKQPIPSSSGLKHSELVQTREDIENTITEYNSKERELDRCSEELSFKQLYEAVIALTTVSQDMCPACKTPIEQTTENPFESAKTGLAKLKHLSLLEKERDNLKTFLLENIKSIYVTLDSACSLIGNETEPNPLSDCLVEKDSLINVEWWDSINQLNDQNQSSWLRLEQQVNQLEALDAVLLHDLATKEEKTEQLKELRKLRDQVNQLTTRKESLEESIAKANESITKFDEENKSLIEETEQEEAVVAQNRNISVAYQQLIELLNKYKDSLPGKLVADLGEIVVNLYNAFNRSDAKYDLLADMKLPTSSGEQILISFQNDPETFFDALHVLSEGHIRCIGLAILLAKNLKEECPILIFDDPVNAIDDDHRESIRRTLFDDDYFQDKQIILTCQGEEFFKDIQNLLGAERTKTSRRFTFLPQLGDKQIRIDFHSTPRNYVLDAREHLDKLEIRTSLEKARQALEALTKDKIWSYVSKHGDGYLSIKLRTANSSIELRQLTEQLRSKLAKPDFSHADKDKVLNPIVALLGIDGDSREWRYLNKGTHEEADRAEFDRDTVKNIIDSLTELDSVLS